VKLPARGFHPLVVAIPASLALVVALVVAVVSLVQT
jgi:hypothetical protein